MLSGVPPFVEIEQQGSPFWIHVTKMGAVPTMPLKFPQEYWSTVSESAKVFLKRCLDFNPSARPTAAELLKHPWITGEAVPSKKPIPSLTRRLSKRFNLAPNSGSLLNLQIFKATEEDSEDDEDDKGHE
jgi:calcium/calmodulin-dependent protein kinase I